MRTDKNLFVGAFGKLQNIGGSNAYVTPHTVDVQPEYSLTPNQNVQGELIARTLDGRMWLFRNDNNLCAVALSWDADTARLKFAASQNFYNFNETVLLCGLDWVLTNSNIFMVSDEAPYINRANLFDANMPDTFLYSLLRVGSVKNSGIDPSTGEAWGKRNDNGNSEGTGYFSKDTHLLYPPGTHYMEHCYSLLPAVGDWQIVENFLIRRPNNPLSSSYNSMKNLRPLIPLEFNGSSPAYGTGYNFDHRGIQLFHCNSEIWGRGASHIGKVCILPAVFDTDGTVLEYYLYISAEFTNKDIPTFFPSPISYFNGHSFYVSTQTAAWHDAKSACETMGGHLATSTSAEKNAFLSSLTSSNAWLGATDELSEGNWEWITGEVWSYTNWRANMPDNYLGKQHYLVTNYTAKGIWDDDYDSSQYLYICEWDYILDSHDLFPPIWSDIALAAVSNNTLYGFLSEQPVSPAITPCFKTHNSKLLALLSLDWIDLSDKNGQLFLDTVNASGMVLHDNGATILKGDIVNDSEAYECITLPQWLAPAGNIQAVSDEYVVAETDNSVLLTSLRSGFNRQNVARKGASLTAKMFTDSSGNNYRLAVSEEASAPNRRTFSINSLCVPNSTDEAIAWQTIFKNAVNFNFINYTDISGEIIATTANFIVFLSDLEYTVAPIHYDYSSKVMSLNYSHSYTTDDVGDNRDIFPQVLPAGNDVYEVFGCIILSAKADILFYSLIDGTTRASSFSKTFSHSFRSDHSYFDRVEVPSWINAENNQIGFRVLIYDEKEGYISFYEAPEVFFPCAEMPEPVLQDNGILPSIDFADTPAGWDDQNNLCNIFFLEQLSSTQFIQRFPFHQKLSYRDSLETFPNQLSTFTDSAGVTRSRQNFHVIRAAIEGEKDAKRYFLFHSEIFPDVFDFDAEVERSNLA